MSIDECQKTLLSGLFGTRFAMSVLGWYLHIEAKLLFSAFKSAACASRTGAWKRISLSSRLHPRELKETIGGTILACRDEKAFKKALTTCKATRALYYFAGRLRAD